MRLRLIGLTLTLVIVSTFLTPVFPLSVPVAAEADYKFRRINTPSDGPTGGWALAKGSDVKYLTRTTDGTLYAYVNPTGTPNRLFKSTDSGVTWSFTGDVTAAIVAIAAAPDDASFIYYATTSAVYRSSDAGATFIALPAGPGGAGAGNIEITAIGVAPGEKTVTTGRLIIVSTRDNDAGEFGGIYTLDEANPTSWQDTGAGPFDAATIAFSPDYYFDRRVFAVLNNEADTFISEKAGSGGWGVTTANARLTRDSAALSIPVVQGALIAFPAGFSGETSRGTGTFFAGLNTGAGTGDVFRLDGANVSTLTMTDLNATANGLDIGALAVGGRPPELNIFAGSAADGSIRVSRDGGKSWRTADKPPTGNSVTGMIIPPDFPTTGKIYAASAGAESAFSVSRDAGLTWYQAGLIDTQLPANSVTGIFPSPNFADDRTVFLLLSATKYHLFRSQDGGVSWERVLCSALPGVDTIKNACLTPAYGKEHPVIYVTGASGGAPCIWRSADAGENWTRTGVPFNIDVMALADDNTLIAGGFSGGAGFISLSTNGGFIFAPKAACGTLALRSMALSPDYAADKTIIAGNGGGWVYLSCDSGASFKPLPPEAALPPLTDTVTVTFDPGFVKNRIVYAASSTLNAGVYRFTVDKSQAWERIDTTLPVGSIIGQVGVSDDGALYAANARADGGIERSVDPTEGSGATFETFSNGLSTGAKLSFMAVNGHQVFTWDYINGGIWTLDDTLTVPVTLTAPANKAQGEGTLVNHQAHNVMLDWTGQPGATSYDWAISPTGDFSGATTAYTGTVEATQAALPALELATSYRWRVRVSQPVLGPWSGVDTFTTCLGEAVMAPQVQSPAGAATGVSRRPIFQWDAIAGAESYELIIGPDPALTTPAISRTGDFAIPGTAWEANIALEYGTVYYWKVRGISAASKSAWSNISAFRTEERPVLKTSPTPPVDPEGDFGPGNPATAPNTQTFDVPILIYYVIGGMFVIIVLLIALLFMMARRI